MNFICFSSSELHRHFVLSVTTVHYLEELIQGNQVILPCRQIFIKIINLINWLTTYVRDVNLSYEPLRNSPQFFWINSLHHLLQHSEELVLGDLSVAVQVVHSEGELEFVSLAVQLHFLRIFAERKNGNDGAARSTYLT